MLQMLIAPKVPRMVRIRSIELGEAACHADAMHNCEWPERFIQKALAALNMTINYLGTMD